MTNAANRQDVRRKEKEAKIADAARREVIVNLLSGAAGRNYVWEQLSASHIFSTSFSPDPLQMAFSEGERNAGLRLLNEILTHCPDEFILMMREQHVHGELDNNRSSRRDGDAGDDYDGEFADLGNRIGNFDE